jgi:uncharacterized protein YutE (UPF0331/DUF86 family)
VLNTASADLRIRVLRGGQLVVEHDRIASELATTLRRMVGFRNVLVHGYDDVDLRVVEDVVANRLGDLLALVAAVRARLP